jgi:hypothetical protein
MKKSFSFAALLLCTLFFFGCKDDPQDPNPASVTELLAKAGTDKSGVANVTIVLDGSLSTGPTGFTYSWSYTDTAIPESRLNFQNKTSAVASFVPPQNGVYHFKLVITSGTTTSEDEVTITVSGAVPIQGEANSFTFFNLEPDPTKPDYTVSAALRLTGTTTIPEGVVFQFSEGAGLELSGVITINGATFTSLTKWKGIYVNATFGVVDISGSTIKNAGNGLFTGETESAAIVSRGRLTLKNSTFENSNGYDLLNGITFSDQVISGNTFTAVKPLKTPAGSVNIINDNTFPASYDYITLSTYGNQSFTSGTADFIFAAKKYLVEDDLNMSIGTTIHAGAHLYFKEGKGFYTHGNLVINGTTEAPVRMEGLGGSYWKGLAVKSLGTVTINGLEIVNAGGMRFDFTDVYDTPELAAIHFVITNNPGTLTNNKIVNSQGYGLIVGKDVNVASTITGNTIGSKGPAVRVPYTDIKFFAPDQNNTYTVPASVAAIELIAPGDYFQGEIHYLYPTGENQFYLVSDDITLYRYSVHIMPGVTLKFKTGKGIQTSADASTANFPGQQLIANGTAEEPIIFEDEAGSWKGIDLARYFELQYCEIRNAGDTKFDNATTKAALIIQPIVNGTQDYVLKNTLVTGSAGWGVLIEANALNQDVALPASANTFTNNALGDVKEN